MEQKEPLAIIGIGCRFPGDANSPSEFWELLEREKNAIVDIPSDRWDKDALYDSNYSTLGKLNVKRGGFIKNIDKFDAQFFGISPVEAKRMDPQQRFLLKVTYQAFEDAGLRIEDIAGSKMGVFIGISVGEYGEIAHTYEDRKNIGPNSNTGGSLCIAANRISYIFDLKGPSFSLDTACSSALVALHQACRSVWSGESTTAIIGGANAILKPENHIGFSKGNFLAQDCKCKAFDAMADGYVRSEGAGVVILKPLRKAQQDGNKIYATIIGTAVNQDGKTPGITIPNTDSQINMLKDAYADAGINPKDIQYVEAHGTGTQLGDIAEANAIGEVIGQAKRENDFCYIGSVKTNIGHLEPASGIAGLIKLALSMKNRKIPKNLHFNKPNPSIKFKENRLKVPTQLESWPKPNKTLFAGINSFGFGGTNAHAVLKENSVFKQKKAKELSPLETSQIFVISANDKQALKELSKKYIKYLSKSDEQLKNICSMLLKSRSMLEHRLVLVGKTTRDIVLQLQTYLEEDTIKWGALDRKNNIKKKIAFVFSGQGPQWWGMGRDLLEKNKIFRDTIQKVSIILKDLGWLNQENSTLIEEMTKDEKDSRINETQIAQPAIFALQVGLFELWKGVGVNADSIVGHSVGEAAASYASGALSLEEATKIIYWRSKCQTSLEGKGKMLAVGLPSQQLDKIIAPYLKKVEVSTINGPNAVTLAGDTNALEKISKDLTKKEIFNKFLKVNIPFHCNLMEPIKSKFVNYLEKIKSKENNTALYSTVSGKAIEGKKLTAQYWYENIRKPVKFYHAIKEMIEDGYNTFIEISPHPILTSSINETLGESDKKGLTFISLRRDEDEELTFITSLGQLIISGCKIDLEKLFGLNNKFIDLPFYPWQTERHWLETEEARKKRLGQYVHPHLVRFKKFAKEKNDIIWKINLDKDLHPYINDHRVQGPIVYPAAGHIELAISIAQASFSNHSWFLENINFKNALFLPEEGDLDIQFEVSSDSGNYGIYSKSKKANQEWKISSFGKINHLQDEFNLETIDIKEVKKRLFKKEPISDILPLYNDFADRGLQLGPLFQSVKNMYSKDDEVLAEIEIPELLKSNIDNFQMHPAVLDACIQALLFSLNVKHKTNGVYIPVFVEKFKFHKKISNSSLWAYSPKVSYNEKYAYSDGWIFDDENNLLAIFKNLKCQYLEGPQEKKFDISNWFYEYKWHLGKTNKTKVNTAPKKGAWLILNNDDKCKKSIKESSHQTTIKSFLDKDPLLKKQDQIIHEIPLNSQKELAKVLETFECNKIFLEKIIFSCGHVHNSDRDVTSIDDGQKVIALTLINLVKTLTSKNQSPHIYIVTYGVEVINKHDQQICLGQAPVWGLGRVMMNEYPEIPITLVDMSRFPNSEEMKRLVKEIKGGIVEEEIAFRGKNKHIHRLDKIEKRTKKTETKKVSARGVAYHATTTEYGVIDNIELLEIDRRYPEKDEVEIKVVATALNFRDVMLAMGMLSEEAVEGGLYGKRFGLESAGKVTRVGENVKGIKIGDKVIACSPDSIGGYALAKGCHVALKPKHISYEEAATIMTVFLTAYYSLNYLCRMSKGQKILIHAAAGGVGLAAIQLAQLTGVEVFATVGNNEKRDYLKSLGVKHIFSSRDLKFKDRIMKVTKGKGVDIVLNSIAGKAITQSIKCLAPFGKFVEIGKRDIYDNKNIELKLLGNNISYFIVDIDRLLGQREEFGSTLIKNMMLLFHEKKITPLPFQEFPISKIKEAFLFLSQSKHIGKVVISIKEKEIEINSKREITFKKDAAYIVSGGCGGFGLGVASWIAKKGGGTLVLIGRNGVKNEKEQKIVKDIEKEGTKVLIIKGDVTKKNDVRRILNSIKNKKLKLKGVIHSAAVFDDILISDMDMEHYSKVVDPKILGAWNLHQETLHVRLDHFIMFSSISAIYGNPGQGNYAAGNIFLDKFAYYRRHLGLPANTINWGVIGEMGFVERNEKIRNILNTQGWKSFNLQQATAIIEQILLSNAVQTVAINADWKKVVEFLPNNDRSKRFGHLSIEDIEEKNEKSGFKSLKNRLMDTSPKDKIVLLQEELKIAVARILGIEGRKIDIETSITDMGIDSLMSMQLRNWIQTNVEKDYSTMKMMQGPCIKKIAEDLLKDISNLETKSNFESKKSDLDRWVIRPRIIPNAKKRIFCFPYTGGDISTYTSWINLLPESVELCIIQMPGRGDRFDEKIITNSEFITQKIATVIKPLLNKPFIFYGHSMGGQISFNVLRYLSKNFNIKCEHFFPGASASPVESNNFDMLFKKAGNSKSINSTIPEKEIIAFLKHVGFALSNTSIEELRKSIIPAVTGDLLLTDSMYFDGSENVECPITAIVGKKDSVYPKGKIEKWEECTNRKFEMKEISGEHLFINENKSVQELFKVMTPILLNRDV